VKCWTCAEASPNCVTCAQPLTPQSTAVCQQCEDGFYLLNGKCYNTVLVFFTALTLWLNFIKHSEIILIAISAILLIDLILMRPYCKVSEKLRSIYFAVVCIAVSLIRYLKNNVINWEKDVLLSKILLGMLCVALLWTYITLIIDFINKITQKSKERGQVVKEVFRYSSQLVTSLSPIKYPAILSPDQFPLVNRSDFRS
jgi:hypothetical protein